MIDDSEPATGGFSKVGTWVYTSGIASNFFGGDQTRADAPFAGKGVSWLFSSLTTTCDTDNDGIANSLDLDSDGDNCPDAIEGGAAFTSANITPAGALTGTVSSAAATLGIPTIANTGQTIGTSQSATVQDAACPVTPTITISSPKNTTVYTANPPISGTATSGASVTVSGPNGQSCVTTASAAGSWSCTSMTFAPGPQTVTAVAGNALGVSNTVTSSFTYVQPLDSDSDSVADFDDLDDDNDGILDSAECPENLSVLWNGANTVNPFGYDQTNSALGGVFSAPQNFTAAPGLTLTSAPVNNNFAYTISNITSTNLAQAIANNQYVEYTFSTQALNAYLSRLYVARTVISSGAYNLGVAYSSDNFATSTLLVSSFPMPTVATNYFIDVPDIELAANKTHKIRYYFFGATGTLDFDDFSVLAKRCDTDGDNVANFLDLDSDGDGCPDAIEGGAAFTTANLVSSTLANGSTGQNLCSTTACVGSTSATMGVPTIAGTGQTNGVSQLSAINGCLDADADGFADFEDLDDDNDGIVDTAEMACENVTNGNFSATTNWLFSDPGVAVRTSDNLLAIAIDNDATYIASSKVLTVNNVPINFRAGQTYNFSFDSRNANPTSTTKGITFAFVLIDGSNNIVQTIETYRTRVGQAGNVPVTSSTFSTFSTSLVAGGTGSYRLALTWDTNEAQSGPGDDIEIDNVSIKYCDTDGDGLANNLDLDSDGDGCPDALEGGAAFTTAAITPAGALTGTISSATATLGIPTQAGTGQTIGTSQDALVQDAACPQPDSDGDGITDNNDLDDDNDGILDIYEDCSASLATSEFQGTFGFTDACRASTSPVSNYVFACQATATGNYSILKGSLVSGWGNPAFQIINGHTTASPSDAFMWINGGDTQGVFYAGSFTVTAANTYNFGAWTANMIKAGQNLALPNVGVRVVNATTSAVVSSTTSGNLPEGGSWQKIGSTVTLQPGVYRLEFYNISTSTLGNDFGVDDIFVTLTTCNNDPDGDGIVNRLDLDTDGDGCPDALEGGAAFTTANLVSTTLANGSTGQNLCSTTACIDANGVPTLANGGQSVGTSQKAGVQDTACPQVDSDNDGIGDYADLDDDNDGILDIYENCTASLVTNESQGTFGFTTVCRPSTSTVSSNYVYACPNTADAQYQIISGVVPANSANSAFQLFNGHTTGTPTDAYMWVNGSTSAGIFYSGSFTVTAGGSYNYGGWVANALKAGNNFSLPNLGFRIVNATTNAVLNTTSSGDIPEGGIWQKGQGTVILQPGVYRLEAFNNSTGAIGNDFALDDIFVTPTTCNNDIDGDGIVNRLDLDTDGDGCPDAIEGGAAFTTANLVSATLANGSTGKNLCSTTACVDANGVPTLANGGQNVGTSQKAGVQDAACPQPDSDGDGFTDSADLDDDNDGIVDTAEMACENVTNGNFSATTNWLFSDPGVAVRTSDNLLAIAIDNDATYVASSKVLTVNNVPINFRAGQTYNFSFDSRNANPTSTTKGVTFAFVLIDGLGNIVQTIETYRTRAGQAGNVPVTSATSANFSKSMVAEVTGSYRLALTWDTNEAQSGPGDDIEIDNVSIKYCDTDGDGLANNLDLDSDGDGCPDALEGGANFTNANLVSSTLAGGSTGVTQNLCSTTACVDANGVPTLANGGQSVGTSLNATAKDAACFPPTIAITAPLNTTASTNPVVSGTATPGSSVTVNGPNGQSCLTTATAAGSWTCTSLTFTPGSQTVTAVASSTAGVSTPATASFTAVSATIAVSISSPRNVTMTQTNPPIVGLTAPFASVTVVTPSSYSAATNPNGRSAATASQTCIVTADAAGNWTCTSMTFAVGAQTVSAIASNTAGVSNTDVSNFTVVASCPNPTVGGTATYAGGALCSISNVGSLTLTGQTGTVVKWQTSVDNGANWTDISGTFGKNYYNFVNAANGQQYRAVLNNGGSCSDAFSNPATISTSPTACSSATCDKSSGTVVFTTTPAVTGSNYSHVVIMTDGNGTIVKASAPGSSTLTNVATGNYLVYLVSYDNTQTPLPTLTVGTNLTAVGGACVVYSSQLAVKVCPSNTFDCANASIAGTFIAGAPSSGTLTMPVTGVQPGSVTLTVSGTGFGSSPSPFVTTLTAGQTSVAIPIVYDGTGTGGVRSLSVSSAQFSNSCSVSVTVNAAIPCTPLTPGQVIPGTNSVLAGGATSFSYVGASSGSTVRWFVAPSSTASPNSGTGTVTPSITFLNAGFYQIIFEETNSGLPAGCNVPSTVQSTLDFRVKAQTPICDYPGSSTVTVSPSVAAIKTGQTGSFTLVGGQPYNNVQWQIIPSTGASPNSGNGATTSTITFSQEGLYRVVYTMTNAGDLTCTPVQKVSSALIAVGLDPCAAPSPINVIEASGKDSTLVGTSATFNASGGVPNQGMIWKVFPTTGVSSVSGTGSTASLTFTQAGNYVVTFIATNGSLPLGCTKPVATAGSTTIKVYTGNPPYIVPVPVNVDPGKSTTVCMPIADADATDSFTATICGQPSTGTATVAANSTTRQLCLTYTAPASGPASTSVCVQVCDSFGNCKQSIIPIVINPSSNTAVTPQPPVVIVVPVVTPKNTPVQVCMPIKDPNTADTHTVSVCGNPSKGTATASVNNTTHELCINYTPTSGSVGQDAMCVIVCDPSGQCTTVTVPITVVDPTPPGSQTVAPKVTPVPIVTTPNTPVVVCTPIVDNTGDTHTASLCGQPSSGTAQVGVNNVTNTLCVTYTPGSQPTSTSLCIQVCDQGGLCTTVVMPITVLPVNQAPIVNPDVNTFVPGKPTSGNVLTNDKDPEGTKLTASTIGTPPAGFTLSPDGSYTYTAPASQTAPVTVPIQVCDAATPPACTTSTLTLTPVTQPNALTNNAPIALNDATRTTAGSSVTVNVVANDSDPDSATSVNGQLNTPTIVSQPATGTASIVNGQVVYTPPVGFTGVVSFPYSVCDKAATPLCTTALVTVTVDPTQPSGVTNVAPVAIDDQLITTKGTPATGTVAANDSDPNGQPLTFTKLTNPANGTVVFNANGTYTYTPAPGFTGTDNFTYQVCDSGSPVLCTTATAYMTVNDVAGLQLLPKAWLQGALFGVTEPTGVMRDDLRSKGFLPLSSPYTNFTALTPTPTLSSSAVFATTGNDAIVDWVFVELRSPTSSSTVVDSRAALIQRDGDIVELDGVSPMVFSLASPGNYFVAVRHRNHLGVMTATAIPLSATGTVVDFRTPATPTYRSTTSAVNQSQITVTQGVALWAGNVVYDKSVIYQGTNNDVSGISVQIKGATRPNGQLFNTTGAASYILNGYYTGDVNLDGRTIYQGTGNDVNYIYQNVTKNHPGNVAGQNFFIIREQLP
ncbi:Ig-like domain-containing protein [Spirosoma sp. 209]|uniref:Ig-like domain-containing protein n=1 Tax=Spirosoma sp. 209 TaxID=1955701 RepID=UPI00098D7016|nr:Ig-like domain-containing protein [Spirosoma sp. 209]